MIIAPSGTGHDGPDFTRITAPVVSDRRKKYCVPEKSDRDDLIRYSHSVGASVRALCTEFGLKPTTIRRIILEETT
jgi:hypothetical protein